MHFRGQILFCTPMADANITPEAEAHTGSFCIIGEDVMYRRSVRHLRVQQITGWNYWRL